MKVLYHIKIATSHKYCLQMSSISEMQKNNGNAVFINVSVLFQRARDGTRTRGPDLGKVVLHQLSHSRIYSSVPDGQIILYMIFFTLSTNLFEFFTTVYFLLFYPVPALYSENSFKRFVNALFCQRAILNRLQYTVISSFKILRHQDHIGPRL